MGDSHANHLQGLLYALHDKAGVGVHLIGTPGAPFPLRRTDPRQPREEIFQKISERLKAEDVVMIARLFINRDGFAPIEPPGWNEDVLSLAAKLQKKKVNLVIMGPLPIFSFLSVEECSLSHELKKPCIIDKFQIQPSINAIYRSLHDLSKRSENIYVFNQFELLGTDDKDYCSPIKNSVSLFHDRDHLNSYGAASMSDSFMELKK